jgi:ABC-2 type transport system ATP-binding protein
MILNKRPRTISEFVDDGEDKELHTLELTGVSSGYSGKQILHNITFKAQESAIYVVLGPNGAGKTTLFRTIAGILEPYSGQVLFDGKDLAKSKEARKRINYLSHYNAIPEEMTVRRALEFYEKIEGGDTDEVISLLNLEELENKKVSDLSQGQKKRVSIAKVFIRERDLYLLDEPTSNLDPAVSQEIRDILLKLSKDRIVLYSSHNLYEARDVGTNLILVRDGTIGYFDKITSLRSKEYRVGIRTTTDISKIIDAKLGEGGYYVLSVSTPEEAGLALKKLVEKGVLVTEMRQLDNPLQDLFEDNYNHQTNVKMEGSN